MLNRKILITGANGFVGRYLCEFYHAAGYIVIACGSRPDELLAKSSIPYHYFRLPNDEFKRLIANEQPEYLLHCAGGASVGESIKQPEKDYIDTVLVTEFVLETLKVHSPKTKLIYFSSAAVYGCPEKLPITLSTPLKPVSPYGQHKFLAEEKCREFYQNYQIQVTILRIFSIYGPRLRKQILWDVYNKAKKSSAILLFGTGEERRDFLYIEDLVVIIHQVMEASAYNGNVINIGSGCVINIKNLVNTFLKVTGLKNSLSFNGEAKQGDPLCYEIDSRELQDVLGKHITLVPLEVGLKKYFDWANTVTIISTPRVQTIEKAITAVLGIFGQEKECASDDLHSKENSYLQLNYIPSPEGSRKTA